MLLIKIKATVDALARIVYKPKKSASNIKVMKLDKREVMPFQQLDTSRMNEIKEAVFQIYPCGAGERMEVVWCACCKAIDESCRRLNRKTK